MDIIVYVPEKYRDEANEDDEHFFWAKVSSHPISKDWEYYWSLTHSPLKIKKNESRVLFSDGFNVIAEGTIIDFDDTNIYFKSLKKVCYKQPKKPPTRGFTYIN